MAVILPAQTRAQILDFLALKWFDALAAIFAVERDGPPARKKAIGVGTGFFMECNGGVAFITADHLVKPYLVDGTGGLALMVKGQTVSLDKKVFARSPDTDLCACRFELSELAGFGVDRIRPVPLMTDRTQHKSLERFAAMGFPCTWNVLEKHRKEGPSALVLFGDGGPVRPTRKAGSFPREVGLEFDPRHCTSGIAHVRHKGVPDFNGMSGGPLFEVFVNERQFESEVPKYGVELRGVVVRRDPRGRRVIGTAREHLFELLLQIAAWSSPTSGDVGRRSTAGKA